MSPLACHWNRQADVVSDSRPTHAHSPVVSGLSSEDSSRDSVSVHLCECSVDRSWLGCRGHCATRSAIRKDLKHILSPLPLTPKIQSHRLQLTHTGHSSSCSCNPVRADPSAAHRRAVARRRPSRRARVGLSGSAYALRLYSALLTTQPLADSRSRVALLQARRVRRFRRARVGCRQGQTERRHACTSARTPAPRRTHTLPSHIK